MPKSHPLFLEIAARLRELASDSETEWSFYDHALEEMADAGLDAVDAVFVLQRGKITKGETQGDAWVRRYSVEDIIDGVHARFVVSFSFEDRWIEIVTAMTL